MAENRDETIVKHDLWLKIRNSIDPTTARKTVSVQPAAILDTSNVKKKKKDGAEGKKKVEEAGHEKRREKRKPRRREKRKKRGESHGGGPEASRSASFTREI